MLRSFNLRLVREWMHFPVVYNVLTYNWRTMNTYMFPNWYSYESTAYIVYDIAHLLFL